MSELTERPREGAETLAELTANYRKFLDFLERRTGDRALAQEILQDAFERSLDKVSGVRSEETALAWFYRVLRNSVIDHARRRSSEERKLRALADELALEGEGPSETRQAVCQCVGQLAQGLKPEYAEAVRRVDLGGESVSEFAAQVGITPNNAAVRTHRAREALRKRVHETCGACAARGCLDCSCGS
ncbi:MAG: sigma-70 family RNA polymerase sigma factor [Myxococcales bacterium]